MKASEWITLVSVAIGSGGLFSLVWAIVLPLIRRPAIKAEATERLTDAAMAQVDQLQERVNEAEKAAKEAREEAEATRQQVRAIRRECADLAERMAQLARWIHQPEMSLERLRAMVPLAPGANGTTGY